MRAHIGHWISMLAAGLLLPAAAPADDAVGQVTAVSGNVTAVREGGESRPLACGDSVFAGERVVTEPGAGAGLLLGSDLHATVGEASTLAVGRTAAGTPDATLARGSVRVIDAREGAQPARLAAGSAAASVEGGDSEAYVLSEKAGGYAMFCEWDRALPVSRGGESRTAEPSQCVIAKPEEPLYVADAHQDRMPLGPDACPPAGIAALGPHFPAVAARDVAAGPPSPFSTGPLFEPLPPVINPCDTPGAVCGDAQIIIDEGPPGGGGAPGIP